jgi:hypothetical protein
MNKMDHQYMDGPIDVYKVYLVSSSLITSVIEAIKEQQTTTKNVPLCLKPNPLANPYLTTRGV